LLILVAVINGVAAAPFLVVVMWVSSDKRLMGDYVNGKAAKILGWATAALHGSGRHRSVRPPGVSASDDASRHGRRRLVPSSVNPSSGSPGESTLPSNG